MRDLLDAKGPKIEIRDNANGELCISNMSMHKAKNADRVFKLLACGSENRSVGATNANENSSRSHLILRVHLAVHHKELKKTFKSNLNLVDLAGSERIAKSEVDGERLKEALCINQSLSSMGKVLNALLLKSSHVPYRDSKLTHFLKESLGGNSKVMMIIQVSPNPNDVAETVSTLNFGSRVATIEKGKCKAGSEAAGAKKRSKSRTDFFAIERTTSPLSNRRRH